ncbi:hypothetical protein YTPLAS73_13630 [Nitrosarchaeum sp.]|nr:hypothetical protein YTPLAS73_13630 [Nitrosarchaeum sp.]
MKIRYTVIASTVLLVLIFGGVPSQSFATSENTGNLSIDVRYTNGDRVVSSGMMLKIYQESYEDVFVELTKDSITPSFTTDLPLNNRYQIEVYIDDVYAGVDYVKLTKDKEHIVINIPTSGGLLLEILYKDGKSISGAEVSIKSPTGKRLGSYITDINGETPRRWLSPTIQEDDYYAVEIRLGEKILHEYSPVHLVSSKKQDLTIITPWPSTIDSMIVQIHFDTKSNLNLDWKKEDLVAVLYDSDEKLIDQTMINSRGEARFSSLSVGAYEFRIILNNGAENEKQVITEELILDGTKTSFDIFTVDLYPELVSVNHDISTPDIIKNVNQNKIDLQTNDSTYAVNDNSPTSKLSCNCVAFRFDDVQNFWLNDVQIKVIDTFHEKNTPVTIGIIGNHFGKDEKLVNSINNLVQDEFDIEIANHGWEHENFAKYQKDEQSDLLKKSNQAILKMLGITPTVFIPPLNSFNEDTLSAMSENGIKYFSTELDESDVVYRMSDYPIYHFPEGATTGKLNKEISLFEGLSHEETFSDILTSMENYGFAVVTMHPQEFSTIKDGTYSNIINQIQLDELKSLIDILGENDIDMVLLSEINEKSSITTNAPAVPQWIKNNAGWWSDKQLSDADFSKDIEYLIKTNIIEIPDTLSVGTNVSEIHIPEWIKNIAGWWSDNLLSNEEFTKSMQYLITKRIIEI